MAKSPRTEAVDAVAVASASRIRVDTERTLTDAPSEAEVRHFRALVGSDSYALATVGLDGTVLSWNPGGERLFGYSARAIVGRAFALLMTEVDGELAALPESIARGETVELEARLRSESGALLDALVTATPIRDGHHEVVAMATIIRDISPVKAMERRLLGVTQLEAMGSVAAGIAHDINNVLAIIQSYAEFVAAGPLQPEQRADLNSALDAARRGAELTSQLLGLNRKRSPDSGDCELNDAVGKVADLLRRALGESITIKTQLAVSPVRIKCSSGQVDRILLNLVLNARDAMPRGGTLSIGVHHTVVGSGHALDHEISAGCYAILSVRDTGIGMSPDTRERIFDPFFTTKAPGKNAGLGLLVVQEAVRGLHGAVRVESELGRGSCFTVFLPLATREERAPSSVRPSQVPGPTTVLVVDDDATLRAAMGRILESTGYAILEAADGAEAEAIAQRHEGQIDLVLCDLVVSGFPETDTIRRVRAFRPDARAVVVSGQTPKNSSDLRGAEYVRKPFAASELLAAVETALVQPAPQSSLVPVRRPTVLIVDPDRDLRDSLVRVLMEADNDALGAAGGLEALQLMAERPVDVVVSEEFMPGMTGTRLLELAFERFPETSRILFTAHGSPDVVLAAVNRGRVAKVLLKNMHAVAIREEITSVATDALRRRAGN